jgi:uncharacterized protein
LDKTAALECVLRFKDALAKRVSRIDKIVLYGSFANGTPRDDSDIDLVVISSEFEDKSYWQRIEILSDAIYDVFAPIEAVALTPAEWAQGSSPVAEFARLGEVIYAA